ncbi:MAG: hypothetical protein ABR613_03355 [Actinomycetota bacterium]
MYRLRGNGRGIEVTFVNGAGREVRRLVDAPWTSQEMTAPADAELALKARGPRGTHIECVMKWRAPRARYGGNNSGESSQISDDTRMCDLFNVSPS